MNGKKFIQTRLSTTGWAPIDAELAKFLEPDAATYYRDYVAFLGDLPMLLFWFPGTSLCRVRIAGFGEVVVIYRAKEMLAERIAWITGGEVEIVPDEKLESIKPHEPPKADAKPMQRDKTELVELARQEPPAHDCPLRRKILWARSELDARGVLWRG